ncbi:MAG: histidine phosphatase family protein [archaeon]
MDVYFVRHGETMNNVLNMTYDSSNNHAPLTLKGREQAEQTARKLRNVPFQAVYASPFMRALETAHIINEPHNLPITVDERLQDRNHGVESMPDPQLVALYEEMSDKWTGKLPCGESFEEEKLRVQEFLQSVQKTEKNCVLVVTHREPIQIALGLIEQWTNEQMLSRNVENGEFVQITY